MFKIVALFDLGIWQPYEQVLLQEDFIMFRAIRLLRPLLIVAHC